MPKSKFKITVSGQEKELLLKWGMFWKNFKINVDGELVGGFESQKELSLGKDFKLMDGSTLSIKLAQNGLTPELQILKDGQALEGSATDPGTRLKTAYGIVLFLGGLNLVMAVIALVGGVQTLLNMGYGIYNLSLGALYLGCVIGGWKNKSFLPLVIAFVLFLGDTVMAFRQSMLLLQNPNFGWIVVRLILGTPIFVGIKTAYKRK